MIPVGALVGAAVAARRYGKQSPQQRSPEAENFVLRTLVSGVVLMLAWSVPYARWGLGPLAVCLCLPALTLRFLLIPLGLARVTYWFARISPPVTTSGQRLEAAAFFGAQALLRGWRQETGAGAWLEKKLDGARKLSPAGLAAVGLLAAARGQGVRARAFLDAADTAPASLVPRLVRRPVQSWLVADAASRGDWRAVEAIGRRAYQRWPRAMSVIARRLLRDPEPPGDLLLWIAWTAAPHRRRTWPILRRALATPRATVAPEPVRVEGDAAFVGDVLEQAVRAHAALLSRPTPELVRAAGERWDAMRVAGVTPTLARRALALETPLEGALARVFVTAEEEIAPFADAAPEGLASVTLEAAASTSRRRVLDDLETMTRALRDRTQREATLDAAGEWLEWTALRDAAEEAMGGEPSLERRRSVFSIVYATACNHAVWLFNACGQKLLANAIFRWLADEASLVGDERVKALLRKNIAAGFA